MQAMELQKRIKHFVKLGAELISISKNLHTNKYSALIKKTQINNPWFTDDSISFALSEIGESLQETSLSKWLENYQINENNDPKTIGLILAGNIPLVGFHDILCALFSGNRVLAKLSSKDQDLYQIILDLLIAKDPAYKNQIQFTENHLKNIDAIIATGSDNSARYFEYYFSKYPNIIRKNRNAVAILKGDESAEDFDNLGKDIFTYFGLGCRNVSFLLIPKNFNFVPLMQRLEKYMPITEHSKYANNYDYQKAILLMNQVPIYDNGCVILKQENVLSSPIGVINYAFYETESDLNHYIYLHKENIQCIVSKTKLDFPTYSFGEAQKPNLWDYADNVDTLQFLIDLN